MTTGESSRSDRFSIDDSVMDIYRALTEDENIENAPFATFKDVFVLAACIGFRTAKRASLPSGKKTTIREEVFTPSDLAILKAIAIASTGDVEVMLEFGDIVTISEEYAHGGIYAVQALLLDQRGSPL